MKILFYGAKDYDQQFFDKLAPEYPGIANFMKAVYKGDSVCWGDDRCVLNAISVQL